MTNKLPEVGKRYKRKGYQFFEIEVCRIIKDSMGTLIITKCERVYDLSNFFELFKEMPPTKEQEEPKEPICEYCNNIRYQNFSAELANYVGHILSQQEENTKRIEKLEKLIK